MNNKKINEFEDFLIKLKPKIIKDEIKYYNFDYKVVRRFKDSDNVFEFNNFNEALKITNQFTTPDKKDMNEKNLISDADRLFVDKNGKIMILVHQM